MATASFALTTPPTNLKVLPWLALTSCWLAIGRDSWMSVRIAFDREQLAGFCRRWHLSELSLFGSVLRPDFGPQSDVDVLVSFAPQTRPSLQDLLNMQQELELLFRRRVDLLTRRSVEASQNYIRRRAILGSAERLYEG
jgi:predicted nucleotidyltransferase